MQQISTPRMDTGQSGSRGRASGRHGALAGNLSLASRHLRSYIDELGVTNPLSGSKSSKGLQSEWFQGAGRRSQLQDLKRHFLTSAPDLSSVRPAAVRGSPGD